MTFSGDLKGFAARVQANAQAVFVNTASAAHESIVDGSSVTGAPGQPVDTGNLRGSWQLQFETPTIARISTNVEYAPYIEDGIVQARSGQVSGHTQQRLVFKNHGPHSVKLTIAGVSKLANAEAEKLAGAR